MLLVAIRSIFILVAGGLAARLATLSDQAPWVSAIIFPAVMGVAVSFVILDVLTPRKRIQSISAVYFGLVVGLILSYFLQLALQPTLDMIGERAASELIEGMSTLFTIAICYYCVSTLLQTKDDFRFIIPYMEFSKEVKGARPLVLDTSVIIDGRIADVAETQALDQPFIVPQFVLQELQGIADSSDKLRRNRGRRGLDILNRLQKSETVEIQIYEGDLPEFASVREVDQRLVILAKHLTGKVVTNDYNLNKIAPAPGGGRHQPQRPGQCPEADRPAGRTARREDHQTRRRARAGRRLPGRRHHGRRRARRRSHRRDRPDRRDQRAPDQRRSDDLRPTRRGPRRQGGPLRGEPGNNWQNRQKGNQRQRTKDRI